MAGNLRALPNITIATFLKIIVLCQNLLTISTFNNFIFIINDLLYILKYQESQYVAISYDQILNVKKKQFS